MYKEGSFQRLIFLGTAIGVMHKPNHVKDFAGTNDDTMVFTPEVSLYSCVPCNAFLWVHYSTI